MKRGLHLGEHQKKALSTNWTEPKGTHASFPGPTPPPTSRLPSAPLLQASNKRQRGQRNSHQRPQTHGKEIRALGTLLPGGSEASPPARLLSRVRVWGLMPRPPHMSNAKQQEVSLSKAGRVAPIWAMCAHTRTGGEGSKEIPVCVLSQGHSQAVTICCPLERPDRGPAPLRSKPSTSAGL